MESALTTTMDMAASQERSAGIAAGEFDHIVRSHQRRVFQVLYSLVRDRDLADNLTQDCFLRAYQKRETFRGEASVETWLIRIAINLARDHVRNRRLAFWRNILQPPPRPRRSRRRSMFPTRAPRPNGPSWRASNWRRWNPSWKKISPQQRLAFSLRFFEEMTLEEIAEAMQLEVGTVKAHLFRAVNAVRNKLKEQSGNEWASER